MPQVPVYSTPQVSPNEGLVDPRGYATPQAFGAGVGREITGFGNQIEKASDVLAKHAMVLQDRLNQSTADQAMADYVIAQSDLDQKQRALEGKARFDNYQNYIEQSQKLREKMAAGMPNIEARRLFDNETRRYFAYSVRNEANGVGTELKRYNIQSSQRVITVANGTVANAPGDDGLFAGEEANVRRAVAQQAEIHSWTPEEKDFQEKEALSNLWATRIQQLAQDDPERAKEMLEQNKDRLNVTDRQRVQVGLAKGQHLAGSRAALGAQEIKNQVNSDIESMLRTGRGVDGITVNKVRATLGEQAADDWLQQRRMAERIWWHTNDVATLPPDRMQAQLRNLTPAPGDKDFVERQEIRNQVEKRFNAQLQLRQNDPAASVDADPAVQEVKKNFNTEDPNGKALLIDARLAAQERAKIPAAMRSPITNDEALELTAPLRRMLPGQERETIAAVADQAKKIYGDKWETAFSYALRAERLSAETQRLGSITMRRLLRNEAAPKLPDVPKRPSLSKRIRGE